jgi:hypothetical protein
VASGSKDVTVRDAKDASSCLVAYAQEHGPTLFRFDEVCSDPGHDLHKLRQLAVAVWAHQWDIKHKHSRGEMPRIYFLVTGKSTQPLEDVGRGGQMSPCGSHFLVLDMLSLKHIAQVRRWLQNHSKVVKPLALRGLRDVDCNHLDACLARATGGAPRLLLYTLRALHHLRVSLGSPD